jgi:hypothetical protein
MYNFEFLIDRCPTLRNKKVLCLHGGTIGGNEEFVLSFMKANGCHNFKLAEVLVGDKYGTFHSKGALIFYKSFGLRLF